MRLSFGLMPGSGIIEDVIREKQTILIYGRIAYTDEAKTRGESGFCRVYSPQGREFNFCSTVPDWTR